MNLQFANFICRFGEDKVLIDVVEEIIIPAFTDRHLNRDAGVANYFFHDVSVVKLSEADTPIIGITGRFIKDTVLSRQQTYDKNRDCLVEDEQRIQSSPSAIFILILNNHRLMYLNETNYAPSLIAFTATVKKFIKIKRQDFINRKYTDLENKVTKKYLNQEYPQVNLEIIPLASESTINDFIQKFDVLNQIQIDIVASNNEFDTNDFFKQFRESNDLLGADKAKIAYSNKNGLSKPKTEELIKPLANQGQSKITLRGQDSEGNVLKGDNDNFKLIKSVKNLPKNIRDIPEIAIQLYDQFLELVDKKIINLGDSQDKNIISEKINQILNNLK
jgi:hypothetical protein